jgi:plastocyanin
MRLLLVIAAVAIAYVATPADADAAAKRAGKPRVAPKAQCAKTAARRPSRARRRALVRRGCLPTTRRLVGESRAGVLGVPGSFAATAPFAPAPAPVAAGTPPVADQPAPVTTPEPVVLPPIYSNPYAVQVQGFEFGLQLSKATVSAGDVRVEFNLSRAEDPHNLWLLREDGTGTPYSFDEEPSGAVVARTLALTRGRWKLFCSLPGHEAAGMRAVLTVGG